MGCWQLVTVYWHACDSLRRCAFEACAFMLKGARFMPTTVPYTVKTNVLEKKRVIVLIRKIILPLISLFSKLVTYTLIPVAIYLWTVSRIQSINIVLIFLYNLPCCTQHFNMLKYMFPDWCFSFTLFRKHFFETYKTFTLPKRCMYIPVIPYNRINFKKPQLAPDKCYLNEF